MGKGEQRDWERRRKAWKGRKGLTTKEEDSLFSPIKYDTLLLLYIVYILCYI
jgi:hypothetical protein